MTAYYARRLLLLIAAAAAATTLACGSNSKSATGPSGGTPTNIVIVSGDSQSGAWNAAIPKPLIVKVTDSAGHAVTNTPVAWITSFDDAPQHQSITSTNASGETQLAPTLVGTPGPFSVSAAINPKSVTFVGSSNITLTPGWGTFSNNLFASCGLTKQGAAFCWGAGAFGQRGDGDTSSHAGPSPVSGGYTFSQVSVGNSMSCGIATGGALYCWGSPIYSGFGNGSPAGGATSYTPVSAASGRKFSQIAVGQGNVCGLSGGTVYCWGYGNNGELGNGTDTASWSPVPISTPSGVTFAYVGNGSGDFSCALSTTGSVYCWGNNYFGVLGTGSTAPDSSSVPLLVTGGHTFTSLGVGSTGVCGLTAAGTVYCWGEEMNGNGTSINTKETTPTAISQSGLTFTQLSVLGPLACAVTAAGAAYCWGNNYKGSLGSGSFSTSGLTPTAVTGGLTFSYVGSGGVMACGLTTASVLYCWGANTSGQLGLTGTADSMYASPQRVSGTGS